MSEILSEDDWWECDDPGTMLAFLCAKFSGRKLRLAACADCVRLWPYILDHRTRSALDAAERFADGEITDDDRRQACRQAWAAEESLRRDGIEWRQWNIAHAAAKIAGEKGDVASAVISGDGAVRQWIHDFAGNPFSRVWLNPAWLTPTVLALANAIYKVRAFERMPILADALEEAGCDHREVLLHCRGQRPHARGCWVVDLLLAKE